MICKGWIILFAFSQDGRALLSASKQLQNDREIVLAAVTQDGYALEFASNDREVVLAAVTQNGEALEYASEDLKRDREIVEAVQRSR